ncbi:MAG TPA: transcriptional regulator, partial [Clostridiaceae bacterium]|nr:transcriptional regulator [Clostridiaceae bacterium]
MEYDLGFAKTTVKVNIDDKNLIGIFHANKVKVKLTGASEVKRALENPIGTKKLYEIVKPGEKIA